MSDAYQRVLMTIIAGSLVWLCLNPKVTVDNRRPIEVDVISPVQVDSDIPIDVKIDEPVHIESDDTIQIDGEVRVAR